MRQCLGLDGVACPELVTRGRCEPHRKEIEARRKHAWPWRWVYADPRWPACRLRAFRRAGFRCEVIEHGERCPVASPAGRGLHGHHAYPGGLRALLGAGLDPFDEDLVRCVCSSHHQRLELEERRNERPAAARR